MKMTTRLNANTEDKANANTNFRFMLTTTTLLLVIPLLLLPSLNLHAKLLDKILAVIDDKIITLSDIERAKENFSLRKQVAPQIYSYDDLSNEKIVNTLIQNLIIRSALIDSGIVVTDQHVESEIKSLEKRLNFNRDALIKLLNSNNASFTEYFELTKTAIEYDAFRATILTPLISIPEQQIKNAFYNRNSSNNTLAFKYNLIDYYIDKSKLGSTEQINNLSSVVKKLQESGTVPEEYKDITQTDLGNVTEDGLTKEMSEVLKKTDEGTVSNTPLLINNQYHVFFVKAKNLVESELYLKSKERIERELFEQEAQKILNSLFEREKAKHFVEYFLN
ncbi:MAG: SurA N-terminal domain-containing protein [Oligoflexia bacterium]|nr:SurA N-terminal domain-containing protein [Oligoflexia bacterium]